MLEVGLQLLEDGGAEAVTITEVCRRARVSPPSLYARVDGRAGLFAAVYERGMTAVRATEQAVFEARPAFGAPPEARAADAAAGLAEVFRRHHRFLRPVIALAAADPDLLRRGGTESQRLLGLVAAALPLPPDQAGEVARTLYAECILRTMYGPAFLTPEPETDAGFKQRLGRLAARMCAFDVA